MSEPISCLRCGDAIPGPSCSHAMCCTPGWSTKGHDSIRVPVLQLMQITDINADTGIQELIPDIHRLSALMIFIEAAVPACRAA